MKSTFSQSGGLRLVPRRSFLPLLLAAAACANQEASEIADIEPVSESARVEATSLTGHPLERLALPEETAADFEQKLAAARLDLERTPDSAEAMIWVGRRTAYLGRYGEAIEVFTEGIERFPEDARFLRHRGHRYLSTRQLDAAVADFTHAYELVQGTPDEIEPDGMPNDQGIPTSTLHSNIRYHLGLAHYLRGEFDRALPFYEEDVAKASNPDMRIASTYWLYLTLRRLEANQRAEEVLATVSPELAIIENHDYHRLLLFFRGHLSEEDLVGTGDDVLALHNATIGFGVATFDLVNGREAAAQQRYLEIVAEKQWAAFGYLAAEAELARIGGSQ